MWRARPPETSMWLPVVYDDERRGEEEDGLRRFLRLAQAAELDALALGQRGRPLLPARRTCRRARRSGAATGPTRPARSGCALTRMPFGANSVAIERTRFCAPARAAEVATMCGSGCSASSELTHTTAACGLRSQQRQEGARRIEQREELQMQLLAPRVVGRVGEGGDAALPRVVDQHVGAAEGFLGGGGEGATCAASSTSQRCANRRACGCSARRQRLRLAQPAARRGRRCATAAPARRNSRGGREADAGAAAGDDRGGVREGRWSAWRARVSSASVAHRAAAPAASARVAGRRR